MATIQNDSSMKLMIEQAFEVRVQVRKRFSVAMFADYRKHVFTIGQHTWIIPVETSVVLLYKLSELNHGLGV